jgi:hypothetical protein
LGLFAPVKYIVSHNDQKFRDKIFHCTFTDGFVFSSANFSGTSKTSSFPVSFVLWDINRQKKLENQKIVLDVFNDNVEKTGIKRWASKNRKNFLSKWIDRPPTDIKFPPFGSAIEVKASNIDRRDKIAEGFLASLMCKGNDCQNQQYTAFLSGPYVSAGALSVTSANFEQAMVVYAARRIPKNAWLNHVDQLMKPNGEPTREFIANCVIWSLFDNKNQTAALKDVKYEKKVYHIRNHFFPFKADDVKKWHIEDTDIKSTLLSAKNTFVADWLAKQKLSPEAKAVLNQARKIYRFYFANLNQLRTKKFKIETYDAGWWQIRQALQESDISLCEPEFEELKKLHNKLKEKLLPQLKDYGIIG